MDAGLYDFAEAGRLLGVTDQTIARICLGVDGMAALVPPEHRWALSFNDLLATSVVITLRKRHFSYSELHGLKGELSSAVDSRHPFANQRSLKLIGISGADRLRNYGGVWEVIGDRQQTLAGPVELYLEQIQFNADGFATRWEPAQQVLLDPEIQAGSPCIAGTRFETLEVFELTSRGYTAEDIARDFELELLGVECAARFEELLAEHVGLGPLSTAAHR